MQAITTYRLLGVLVMGLASVKTSPLSIQDAFILRMHMCAFVCVYAPCP